MQVLRKLLGAAQLLLYIEEELVVDGAPLAYEPLHGRQLTEGADDGAAPQGEVGSISAAREERLVGDVDIAEPAVAFGDAAHDNGREDAAVQDGQDDVAPPCEPARRILSDEAQLLVLALRETGEDVLGRCREC